MSKDRRVTTNENELVRNLRPFGNRSQVEGTNGSASCVITCLIYFTSQKLSAMTEPIYSDPHVSVRQTKGRLQWNLPAASNGISMNPRAGRSERADSPTIRESRTRLPEHPLPQPICYYRFTLQGWNAASLKRGEKEAEKMGGYFNFDQCTLTFARASSVRFGRGGFEQDGSSPNWRSWTLCLNW